MKKNKFLALTMLCSVLSGVSVNAQKVENSGSQINVKTAENSSSERKGKIEKGSNQKEQDILERWKKMSLYQVTDEYLQLSYSERWRLYGVYDQRFRMSSIKERFMVDFSPTLHPIQTTWGFWELFAMYSIVSEKKGKLHKLCRCSLVGLFDWLDNKKSLGNKKSPEEQKIEKLKETLETLSKYSAWLDLKETFKEAEKEFQNQDLQKYKQDYKNSRKYFISEPLQLGDKYVGYVSEAVNKKGYGLYVTKENVDGFIEHFNFYVCFFSNDCNMGLEFVYCLKGKEKYLFNKASKVKDEQSMNDFDNGFYLADKKYDIYGFLSD